MSTQSTPITSSQEQSGAPIKIRGAIETRSIDYVPESERHGKVWQQGPFWFLGNFQFFTIAIGFLGPTLGLSLGYSVLAGALGIVFGTFFMAFHATQGAKLGLPQMIQSRAQFGYRGVVVVLFASLFTFLAFNVVDAILVDDGLNGIFGWNKTVVGLAITIVAAILAIYGHDWLHVVFRVLFVVSLPFYVILTIGIMTGHAGGSAPPPAANGGLTLVGFMSMFTAAAAYNITYAPYVSDYSRYLPRNTRSLPIIAAVFGGAAASAIWLIAIGAWLSSRLGADDGLVALRDAGNNMVHGLGTLLAILSVLALVATMGLNAYSGMLSAVTGVDSVRPIKPTRRARVITIVVLSVIWAVIGIGFGGNVLDALSTALIYMLYLLVPWTAVNLVDFFAVRRGHYAITDLFTPHGIYGAWGSRGLISYAVGLITMLPFAVLPAYPKYTGFLAAKLDGVDYSIAVGLIVSGALYWLLCRTLDLSAEVPAIARSEQELRREDVPTVEHA
ncbi:cytosine permease [Jatrophihabitans telluris]|uniref:Cytosine permease n=1 Tax=Jatrophihabitans telluris TaxID=2038343 RepID=A0ABY4R294_9ACTN|nr:cytosine permease [Jatrophihabitans telluris]UQX89845.1 cytosine permease [Jatrophihabitans telluris]